MHERIPYFELNTAAHYDSYPPSKEGPCEIMVVLAGPTVASIIVFAKDCTEEWPLLQVHDARCDPRVLVEERMDPVT